MIKKKVRMYVRIKEVFQLWRQKIGFFRTVGSKGVERQTEVAGGKERI